jgi:hypothetical protein
VPVNISLTERNRRYLSKGVNKIPSRNTKVAIINTFNKTTIIRSYLLYFWGNFIDAVFIY